MTIFDKFNTKVTFFARKYNIANVMIQRQKENQVFKLLVVKEW